MSSLWPFLLFCTVASITPGPTNILVLSNSARFGLPAALPIILGASGGAVLIVWLMGLGLGQWLLQHALLRQLMAWAGVLWLSWMGWQLARSSRPSLDGGQASSRMGVLAAAGLQWVNPKTWMMALAVVSLFSGPHADARHYLGYGLLFFLISLPCLGCWALLGRGSARVFHAPRAQRWFNRTMAALLVLSAWTSLLAGTH